MSSSACVPSFSATESLSKPTSSIIDIQYLDSLHSLRAIDNLLMKSDLLCACSDSAHSEVRGASGCAVTGLEENGLFRDIPKFISGIKNRIDEIKNLILGQYVFIV